MRSAPLSAYALRTRSYGTSCTRPAYVVLPAYGMSSTERAYAVQVETLKEQVEGREEDLQMAK
eukprot:2409942-Rhodomonas_salina.1